MRKLLFLTLFVQSGIKILAQGCSDAGFCTIHSIKNNTEREDEGTKTNNELLIGLSFGKGERSVSVYTTYAEYTRNFSRNTSATARISFAAISGELANTNGPGDIYLSINHGIGAGSRWHKSVVAGLKFPLDRSNIVKNGIHLPMPYQTSLGTTDLIAGLNILRNAFGATLAFQLPLQSSNSNRFLPADYPNNKYASEYLPTNQFRRKGDVLLRTSWNVQAGKKFSIRPSLLGIYHLANDSYLDSLKMRIPIPASKGLTLNANLFIDYRLSTESKFEISFATPFLVRKNRPDGLTRSFVAAIEYKINF
jgi:hypothetical protein